jgi:SAM-dependent methyltransferase
MRPQPRSSSIDVVEANRRFYSEAAATYDQDEECVVDERNRSRLRMTLKRVLSLLPRDPDVLDACGGTGNASLLLYELGVHPTTVDISPDMLREYERKAAQLGLRTSTHLAEIDDFLECEPDRWDLIVFSSALHHLEHVERTVDLALRALAPNGVVVAIFEPTALGSLGRTLRRLDYLAHVLLRSPRRVPELLGRRLRRGDRSETTIGARAEYHALHGIDDSQLRRRLEHQGAEIILHERLFEGRFLLTRLAFWAMRLASSFTLAFRRVSAQA